VVPLGSKALFGFAAVAMVSSTVYGFATKDASAATVLVFVSLGALVLGLAVAFAGADRAPWLAADAPHSEQTPVGDRPAAPSLWPLAAAGAFGVLTVAAATTGIVLIAAAVLLVLIGLAWLIQHWTEQPSYTPVFGGRIRERFLLPFGLPVAVMALVAIIAISLSRIFLALPEQGTRAVALAIAVVILLSAFVVAASERAARTALALLSAVALTAAIGAGVAGVAHGERRFEKAKETKPFVPAPGQAVPTTAAAASASSTTIP
jgi:hypothetical protein